MDPQVQAWVEEKRSTVAKLAWEVAEKEAVKAVLGGIDPTALRTLLSAFVRASCLEEARIVLRYQQGRDRDKWPKPVVEAIEAIMARVEKEVAQSPQIAGHADEARVALLSSWLGYLVQLHRFQYTSQREARQEARSGHVR